MRKFTDGEKIVFDKVDRGEDVSGHFFIEIARRLAAEGHLKPIHNVPYSFWRQPSIKLERTDS